MRRRSIRGKRESGGLRLGEGNGFGIRANFKAKGRVREHCHRVI